MKTHPDSIFVESSDFSGATEHGVSTECLLMTDPSGLLDALEFVPASAYVEAMAGKLPLANCPNHEAGDATVVCSVCGCETDEPHTAKDCVAFTRNAIEAAEAQAHDFLAEENTRLNHELTQACATIAKLRTAETERPQAPTIQPPPEWAWYIDEASPCVAGYRTEEEALAEAVRDYGEDHRIMVGQMRDVDPSELFDLDDVVERVEDRLYDLVEDGHIHPSDGAAEALAEWARRYLDVDPARICDGRQAFPKKADAADVLEEETRL